MKKYVFTLTITLCLMFSLVVTASASEIAPSPALETKSITHNGFSFEIGETIDKYNRVTRVYTKNHTNSEKTRSITEPNYAETKALLSALGMEEYFIQQLSPETLYTCATSPELTTTVSYLKSDSKGNIVYLDETTATSEAYKLSITQDSAIQPMEQSQTTFDYIRVYHLAARQADNYGGYLFVTDGRWLTMPKQRLTDSIGSCAQISAFDPASPSGWCTVDMTYVSSGSLKVDKDLKYYTITKGQSLNTSKDTFVGMVGKFPLLADTSSAKYTNLKAHFQYYGRTNYPQLISNFNSIGTYTHLTASLGVNSIDIRPYNKSGVPVEIGIGLSTTRTPYPVALLVHYTP